MEIRQGSEKVGEVDVEKGKGTVRAEAIGLRRLRRPMVAGEIAKGRTVDGIPSVQIGVLEIKKKTTNLATLVYKHYGCPGLDYESIIRFLLAAVCKEAPEFFVGLDDIKVEELVDLRDDLVLLPDLHCDALEDREDAFGLVPWQKVYARGRAAEHSIYDAVYAIILDVVTGWPGEGEVDDD
jgi:hypothetical protein